ncbi:hypothetical protein ITP53_50660 [Nonomuraea sp. K274]|uniref:Uncharacterized protein n=1 Tax=Nonomuraea cypriaca TaxID=1187855 RepID=A0A931AMQ8_9ACTN|nr:hypothetical protein [Nonomuraea cypriaca]MBF8193809.1 hypothetical protein [Nonomuraea cypriaca]
MYIHQYHPQAYFDGAATWLAVHDDVVATRLNVDALVAEVAVTSWRSEDGRTFQRRMDAYLADLRSIEIRAVITALVLYTVGGALVAMIFFQFLVATAMAAVALWVVTAAVTPLSLAAARLTAMQCLIKLFEGYRAVESLLDTLLHGCAAALSATVVVDVGYEAAHDDPFSARLAEPHPAHHRVGTAAQRPGQHGTTLVLQHASPGVLGFRLGDEHEHVRLGHLLKVGEQRLVQAPVGVEELHQFHARIPAIPVLDERARLPFVLRVGDVDGHHPIARRQGGGQRVSGQPGDGVHRHHHQRAARLGQHRSLAEFEPRADPLPGAPRGQRTGRTVRAV